MMIFKELSEKELQKINGGGTGIHPINIIKKIKGIFGR